MGSERLPGSMPPENGNIDSDANADSADDKTENGEHSAPTFGATPSSGSASIRGRCTAALTWMLSVRNGYRRLSVRFFPFGEATPSSHATAAADRSRRAVG
jgi:hypothetical protein